MLCSKIWIIPSAFHLYGRSSTQLFPQKLILEKINSLVDTSLNIRILIFSTHESIVICPLHFYNLYFLLSYLTFISQTSFRLALKLIIGRNLGIRTNKKKISFQRLSLSFSYEASLAVSSQHASLGALIFLTEIYMKVIA